MISLSRLIFENDYVQKLCCLCLKHEAEDNSLFNLKDDMVMDMKKTVEISEILKTVLGNDVKQNLGFESICKTCTGSLLNCYKFINNCKRSSLYLKKIVDTLMDSFSQSSNAVFKTIFVSFNLKYQTSMTYCSPKKYNLQTALSAIQSGLKNEKRNTPKRRNNKNNIKTSDMMLIENSHMKCKVCLKIFQRHYNLRAHYMRIHAPKKFKCTNCNKMFASQPLLKHHKAENHTLVVCSECGKSFTNLPTLKAHEESHKLRIVCSDCGRVYKRHITFKQHKQLNICGQKTRKSSTNAVYVCDHCNKKYCLKSSLRVHIQFKHGNGTAHTCTWCNKKFSAQSLLKAHVNTHIQDKKFICELCFKKFSTKVSLTYHKRIHTGERPYQCLKCDCKFISATRRIEHEQKFHKNLLSCTKCLQNNVPVSANLDSATIN